MRNLKEGLVSRTKVTIRLEMPKLLKVQLRKNLLLRMSLNKIVRSQMIHL